MKFFNVSIISRVSNLEFSTLKHDRVVNKYVKLEKVILSECCNSYCVHELGSTISSLPQKIG